MYQKREVSVCSARRFVLPVPALCGCKAQRNRWLHWAGRLSSLAVLGPTLFLVGESHSAAQTIPTYPVQVIAKNSGKCLDVAGISKVEGTAVQQWTCWGGENQKWLFTDNGDGTFQITSSNSGMALSVAGDSPSAGGGIVQWPFSGSGNQKWHLQSVGNGYYNLTADSTGMCLDVTGGPSATGDGVLVQQWTCWGADNQAWQLDSSHRVSLTWDTSTSSNVTGYYVYRATQSGGPYTKLSSLLTTTSYVDASVQAGQTYYYATTAADSAGAESAYSNQVATSIPTP